MSGETSTRPDRAATVRRVGKVLGRILLSLLAVAPCLLSLVFGYLTMAVTDSLTKSPPATLLVAVLALLPPVVLGWFGARAPWRRTSGWGVAAWIVAAWTLALVEGGIGLGLFSQALSP